MKYVLSGRVSELDSQLAGLLRRFSYADEYLKQSSIVHSDRFYEIKTDAEKLEEKLFSAKSSNEYDELILREMERHVNSLQHHVKEAVQTSELKPSEVVKFYDLPQDDLEYLEVWLENNQGNVKKALEKQFSFLEKNKSSVVNLFNLKDREEMEKVIRKYHKVLGDTISEKLGIDFSEVSCEPTLDIEEFGLYYSSPLKHISINAEGVLRRQNSKIEPVSEILISVYGHEGMGHGAHDIVSEALPVKILDFKNHLNWTLAQKESVAQHFKPKLFEALAESGAWEKLGIKDFSEVQSKYEVLKTLIDFQLKRNQYAVYIFSRDDLRPEEKFERINKVSFNPKQAWLYRRRGWANDKGELADNSLIGSVLIYSTRPVERALSRISESLGEKFCEENEDKVNRFLLEGAWTNKGFLEKTELFIKENK